MDKTPFRYLSVEMTHEIDAKIVIQASVGIITDFETLVNTAIRDCGFPLGHQPFIADEYLDYVHLEAEKIGLPGLAGGNAQSKRFKITGTKSAN